MSIRNQMMFILSAAFCLNVGAATIEEVEFTETKEVGGQKLILNGMGLRKVEKFGFPFKVYVAGLYLKEKSSSDDAILGSKDAKVLKMVFLRRVGKSDIADAFNKGLVSNCGTDKAVCEESKKTLKQLTDKMPDLLDKSSLEFIIQGDKVDFDVKARSDLKGTMSSTGFGARFLAIFIGPKPPTEVLKNGLIGKGAK